MVAINEIYGLDTFKVWDINLVFQHLNQLGLANSRRTAIRLLYKWKILPDELQSTDLKDQNGYSPTPSVLNWEIEQARSKRKLILFSQLLDLPNGISCLHANDPRGARYWVPFNDSPNLETFIKVFQELHKHIKKPIVIFMHGSLAKYFNQSQYILPGITISLLSYPPNLDLTKQQLVTKSKQLVKSKSMSHLDYLEAESIHIIREAVAEAQNPMMLYSIGKDSSVMLHLARKAFFPSDLPISLMHIDTRWKFQEMYLFRDAIIKETKSKLLVHVNPDAIAKDINPFTHGSSLHTDITKTEGLKQALDQYQVDVVFGGARRDEEKSRAKERIFSFRTEKHHWDPKNQRPEVWHLYNAHKNPGESIRVFPLSNWTELDIWQYIYQENIPVVPLYFAKERPVVIRNGLILMIDDYRMPLFSGEKIQCRKVRFRTLGCYPLTGAIDSNAETIPKIILELLNTQYSERQGRAIDTDASASMERKKQEGYF